MSEWTEPTITVTREPDYVSEGHFHEGHKPYIPLGKIWSLPIGTKLYTEQQMQARARIAEQREAELVQDVRDLLGWREQDYSGDRAKHAIEHMESKARAILAKHEGESK